MSEQFITKLAEQVPNLAVLCFLAWLFLRAMEKRDLFIKNLHDEHLDAREQSRTAIRQNTSATRELTGAIQKMER